MKTQKKTSLKKLYNKDQKERILAAEGKIDAKKLVHNDRARKQYARVLYKNNLISTPRDLFYAAMLFHHGASIADAKIAKRLARMSMVEGFKKARWLYAAATDRLLMKQKRPQKYGTQFFKKNEKRKWVLYEIDQKTTDKERAVYNVPALSATKERLCLMNKKKD